MCAIRTIKKFDQVILVLSMKFMSLGYYDEDTFVYKHILVEGGMHARMCVQAFGHYHISACV